MTCAPIDLGFSVIFRCCYLSSISHILVEMESDREVSMASKAGDWLEKYTQEEIDQMREECIRLIEEMDREKMARDEVINSKDREAMIEDYNAEEMNIIANEKMLRRRRERFVRHFRRRSQTPKKNSKSSPAEESFTSESDDDEMKISVEEMKRLMEKAIQENMTWTLTAKDEVININDGEASKAEEINMADEKMFPRRRGRLIRYLRRQSSKSPFQIGDHHLQLPMAEESFMSFSDESDHIDKAPK